MSEKVAFKDFPNAVSVSEFEAVLNLCRAQHNKMKKIVLKREEFLEKTKQRFGQAESQIDDNGMREGLHRLVDALVKKADKELLRLAGEEVEGIEQITEFLIRFSPRGEYEQLDLSFINDLKEEK